MTTSESAQTTDQQGPGENPTPEEIAASSSEREAAEREAVRKLTHRTPEDLHPDARPEETSGSGMP